MEKLTPQQLHEAADALDREEKRMKGVMAAARVLRDLGTLQGRIEESERRLVGVNADVAAAQRAVEEAKAEADQVRRTAAGHLATALADTKRTAEKAEEAARKVHADAVAEAEQLVADAQAEVERRLQFAVQTEAEAAALVEQHKAQAADLGKLVAERRAELEELEARLAAAKEQAKRLLSV